MINLRHEASSCSHAPAAQCVTIVSNLVEHLAVPVMAKWGDQDSKAGLELEYQENHVFFGGVLGLLTGIDL